jgi:hypothetical protein
LATPFGPKLFKILEDWWHHATWEQALAKDLNYEFPIHEKKEEQSKTEAVQSEVWPLHTVSSEWDTSWWWFFFSRSDWCWVWKRFEWK